MKRAIVVFIENKPHLMLQFGCLYTSLKYIQSKDTAMVVFGTPEALKKVPEDCIKIESEAVSYKPEWQNYHYINSIHCLTDKDSEVLGTFDLLLRTDVDTFLTPAWNSYYPQTYQAGRGGYVNDMATRNKLFSIASALGLRHQGIFNIGSTHYGAANLVRDVCKVSMTVASYIFENEFKDGEGSWPGWYKGVTSMYACEIAVNHCVDHLTIDHQKLDFGSAGQETVKDHPHIHCWHTDVMFSKFMFEAGKYDHLSTDQLDLNKVCDYCLYIALKSKQDMPWLTDGF